MSATRTTRPALGPGMIVPKKRALFGLLDADSWTWAGLKAFVWLVIIILLLGYIPDRAYYLTVNRAVDLGRSRHRAGADQEPAVVGDVA